MINKRRIRRVDVQVSIFTAIIVIASFLCVYFFNYHLTYADMMDSLEDRAMSIYDYVEEKLGKDTFHTINDVSDTNKDAYITNKKLLEDVKGATGVMYLYTAKKKDDGSFIYVLDGLDETSPDFRNPGDAIEEEIIPELQKALDDELVLPSSIKSTTWGKIFISYMPIHENGKVVGVIGIEFKADHQYNTYHIIRIGTPLIALGACLIAVVLALVVFKRISNPFYKDMANSDYLTDLKNRNAFELDIQNWRLSRSQCITMFSIDLNDLKYVNDTFSHREGDTYIRHAAKLLHELLPKDAVLYRIGGDEFAAILSGEHDVEAIIKKIDDTLKKDAYFTKFALGISIGYAQFDYDYDDNLEATYHRADQLMYEHKRIYKETHKR